MAGNNTTKPALDDLPTLRFAVNIAVFVVGILSILTNGTLLVVTVLDPLKKFKRSSIYFITSLSVSDFLTAIISCIFAFKAKVSLDPIFQEAIGASIWASVQNSFITVLLLAVERLFVVKEPLRARRIITRRRTVVAIAITWIASVLSGGATGISYEHKSHVQFALLIEFMLIVLAMILIYLRILVLLKRSDYLFEGKRVSGGNASCCQMRTTRASVRSQHNLNLVVFIMAVILISTVVPHLIIGLVYHGFRLFCPNTCALTPALNIAAHVSFPIEMLHFVLNPVVYAWRLREYRQSLRYCLSRRITEGQNSCGLRTSFIHSRKESR